MTQRLSCLPNGKPVQHRLGGLDGLLLLDPVAAVEDERLLDCLYIGLLATQVDIPTLGEMDPALLPAFETSFLKSRSLWFRYCDAHGTESERQVEPQAMLILPPLWYLVAWDPTRDDFRHFRMDRIIQPDVIDGTAFRSRRVRFDSGVQPVRYA